MHKSSSTISSNDPHGDVNSSHYSHDSSQKQNCDDSESENIKENLDLESNLDPNFSTKPEKVSLLF